MSAPSSSDENDENSNTGGIPSTSVATTMTVEMTHVANKRCWDKKQCCPYCKQMYAKLPRHLEQKHSKEADVIYALSCEKKSISRKVAWEKIRKKGNYGHNVTVLKSGKGKIIPFRRPTSVKGVSNYIPCSHCLGFFLKADIWKHIQNCTMNIKNNKSDKQKISCRPHEHQQAGAALLPTPTDVATQFKDMILHTMTHDEVSFTAKNDRVILAVGQYLWGKNGHFKNQHQYIKQKMRELARFLIEAKRQDDSVESLSDCIDPKKFHLAVDVVRNIAGLNDSGDYEIPSLAKKLGGLLKKSAGRVKFMAAQEEDDRAKDRATTFIEMCTSDWVSQISAKAINTLEKRKYNKARCIPFGEDVTRFHQYLDKTAQEHSKKLTEEKSETSWRTLNEVTLVQLTIVNRRRAGEPERMTGEEYENGLANGGDMQSEVAATLSPFEQALCKRVARVEMRGKRGRKVAVLLMGNTKKQLELLYKTRSVGNIRPDNEYIFARPHDARTHLRSTDVIRHHSKLCGAKQPSLLRSTPLRKHMAVIAQLLNMKEHEMDLLAGFMGHDIRVHRDYYRLPESTLQVAKIGKLLLQLEKGTIQNFKGKSLDDITIDDDGEFLLYGKIGKCPS